MFAAIAEALGNFRYLMLYALAFAAGLFLLKGRRKAFLIPGALLTAVIMNPVFFKLWNRLNGYAYWRTLWMIPVIPVCAAVPAALVERVRGIWMRIGAILAAALAFALAGSFVYTAPGMGFTRAENPAKLPKDAVRLADEILELDDAPYVVADANLSVYMRQYSGKIHTLFARDIVFGVPSRTARILSRDLSYDNGDLNALAQGMLDEDFEYLITHNYDEARRQALESAGFELLKQVDLYGIYRVTGSPSEIRAYNELHQVVSRTMVDPDGNPVEGADGYATTLYDYDTYGNVIYEFHLDAQGNGAGNARGRAGTRRTYNRFGAITSETYLGVDGEPISVGGFATRKCEYTQRDKLASEAYFDESGAPAIRTNTLYASRRLERDSRGNILSEAYYGVDGEPVLSVDGYASCKRQLDDSGRPVLERYFDAAGQPIRLAGGYAALAKRYDGRGNLTSQTYLDASGAPVAVSGGYASCTWAYDDDGNVVDERYFDAAGEPTNCVGGYAGVKRSYYEKKLWWESYYDVNGNSTLQRDGYAASSREYDKADNIICLSYYGLDGALIVTEQGYAEVRRSYDANRHLLRAVFYGADGAPCLLPGGYAGYEQSFDRKGRLQSRRFFGVDGGTADRTDGYSEARWVDDAATRARNVEFLSDGNVISEAGINLVLDGPFEWSPWMTPDMDVANFGINFASANLGEKAEGETYTCQIEIEFRDVTATEGQRFGFRTQGAVDGSWTTPNIWNRSLVQLSEAPGDGVYRYTSTETIQADMLSGSSFGLSFRCDYWASGSFRVRGVKVEKGETPTGWTPGL